MAHRQSRHRATCVESKSVVAHTSIVLAVVVAVSKRCGGYIYYE